MYDPNYDDGDISENLRQKDLYRKAGIATLPIIGFVSFVLYSIGRERGYLYLPQIGLVITAIIGGVVFWLSPKDSFSQRFGIMLAGLSLIACVIPFLPR